MDALDIEKVPSNGIRAAFATRVLCEKMREVFLTVANCVEHKRLVRLRMGQRAVQMFPHLRKPRWLVPHIKESRTLATTPSSVSAYWARQFGVPGLFSAPKFTDLCRTQQHVIL